MAHLDFKIPLKDAEHSKSLKQAFESMGATLLFSGKEEDKIFYLQNNAFLKQRHSYGIGDKRWAFDSASDEFIGYHDDITPVNVNQKLEILYRKIPNTPAPHYIIDMKEDMQRGIADNIFTRKGLYAEVSKQRDIYRLSVQGEPQGTVQSNLRIHFDCLMLDKPLYFLEVEAKFPNNHRKDDLIQAEKQLQSLKKKLNLPEDQDFLPSYGSMVRQFKMNGIELSNGWLEDVPFDYLADFATSPQKEYKSGQYLMKAGDYNDGGYVMLQGGALVNHNGNEHAFGHGVILGELATMNRSYKRCADVSATTDDTVALHVSKELMFELDTCPGVATAWARRYLPSPL